MTCLLLAALSPLAVLVVAAVAACMRSSQCSRMEERRGEQVPRA